MSELHRAYLALGSNLGDRRARLQDALDRLAGARGVRVAAVSRVYETTPVGGPVQGNFLNAVVAVDTAMGARELLELAQELESAAGRVRTEHWGPRSLDVDVLIVGEEVVDAPDLVVPHPRMRERGFVLAPLHDVAPDLVEVPPGGWPGVAVADCTLVMRERDEAAGAHRLALVGPGRAGSVIASALVDRGWKVVAVAGRAPDAASTRDAAACLGAPTSLVSEAGRGAQLVVIATPDAAIEGAARTVAPSLEAGALVIHLAGSRGIDVFAPMLARRPDVRAGALHPLQSLPSTSAGLDRLPGSWAAVAGDGAVEELARDLGMHPFPIADDQRVRYHAAAVVASNHLVALLGQVERMAAACGVPFAAFEPLVRASMEHAFEMGPRAALTGPVSRGDLATVAGHLDALDPADRDAYRALAREAARLAGRRETAIDRLLEDLSRVSEREAD